jgi:4-hydroxy-3-methylbut-2-enyl diphosphate reductase IspH
MLMCVENNCPECKKKVFQVFTMDADMYTAILMGEKNYRELVKIGQAKTDLHFREMKHIEDVISAMRKKRHES